MLANLFFYIIMLGLLCLMPYMEKYKKMTSWFFVIALACAAFYFWNGYTEQINDTFSFFWMRTQRYHIEIDIDSSLKNYIRLLPVFAISLVVALYGVFVPEEKNERNFYACVAFNLANMILLVSSKNLVQLITCVCLADIISQSIIHNFGVSKKYIFYSLLADFGLFMIFAIVQGKLQSFNIDAVSTYKKIGRHKDFVAIATLLFIFAKMGLFMFQSALLDLKNIKTCKLISIVSVSGVLASFFVLIKIYPLLQISSYSEPLLLFAVASSAVWGLLNGIIMGGANRHIVYFNMLLYSFVIYIFMLKGEYVEKISYLLILGNLSSFALSVPRKYAKASARIFVIGAWCAFFYLFGFEQNIIYMLFAASVLMFLLLSGNIHWFYKFNKIQKADLFSRFYDLVFVKPVMILGRGLWLMVDFIIMERHVVGSVEAAGNISSGYIEKIRNCSMTMRILWLLLLFMLFAASFYFGGIR